jgi:glutathione S-transferase
LIRLHHVPQARSFRTLWLLEEMGLDFQVIEHSFFDKSLRAPEYLALSPAGRVPALEVDGQVLFESGAIAEYLCETRAGTGLGRPPSDGERIAWLEWLHYAETLGQHAANLTQHHIMLREEWMRSPTVMKLEAKRLEKALAPVDELESEWMLRSGFSAVDCGIGYGVLIAARFLPDGLLPGVDAYRARFMARPAYRRAAERDGTPQIYRRGFYPVPEE